MRICSPCLFYDDENHIWRFYINSKKDLMYSIMYDENQWTKEIKIDNEVLDFTVDFDIDNKIYIIYSVKNSDLKYCIWEQQKWFGKTIYSFENKEYEMTELSVIRIGKLMHIFFIGKNNINITQCSLMHFCINKDGNSFDTIDTITFLEESICHYQVDHLENNNLSLIYIKDKKNEVVMNFTEYKNNKWSVIKKLYGIIGNSINFCTLLQRDKINIMNLSKDRSLYLIEHVIIEHDGKMKNYKIHESDHKPTNFLLIELSGILWSIWSEGGNVFSSSYKNQWSEPDKYYSELINEISIYKCLSLSNKYNKIKCKYILGTNPPEINLLLPKSKNDDYSDVFADSNKVKAETKVRNYTNYTTYRTAHINTSYTHITYRTYFSPSYYNPSYSNGYWSHFWMYQALSQHSMYPVNNVSLGASTYSRWHDILTVIFIIGIVYVIYRIVRRK